MTSDVDQWITALDRIRALDIDHVIPGHGPVQTKDYLATQRSFMLEWKAAVAVAIAKGWSREETIARVSFAERYPVDIGQEYMMDYIQERNAGALYDKLTGTHEHHVPRQGRAPALTRSAGSPSRVGSPAPPEGGRPDVRPARHDGGPRRPRAVGARDPGGPGPGARAQRGPRAGPRGVHLRHRRPPHPGRLPGLLAARVPVHPGARVGGRDRRPGPGRRALRLAGRRPRRGHQPRRLRRVPRVRRGPLQPVRELRARGAAPPVRPQRPGRRRDLRRAGREDDLRAAGQPLVRGRGADRPGVHRPPRRQPRQHHPGRHRGHHRCRRDRPARRRCRPDPGRGAGHRRGPRPSAGQGGGDGLRDRQHRGRRSRRARSGR